MVFLMVLCFSGGYGAAITLLVLSVDEHRFQGIGAEGQLRVRQLPNPETEKIPLDLTSNMEYWEQQSLVSFPVKKPSVTKLRGRTKKENRNPDQKPSGSRVSPPKEDPDRILPEEYKNGFQKKLKVGVESGESLVYSREECLKLNPEGKERKIEENGVTLAFDPIDDLEYWEHVGTAKEGDKVEEQSEEPPADTKCCDQSRAVKKEESVFSPINDLEYWERPQEDISLPAVAPFVGSEERKEYGVPIDTRRYADYGSKEENREPEYWEVPEGIGGSLPKPEEEKNYGREEILRIRDRGVPEHQLRIYAESKWDLTEEPFVKDPSMRCPYSQQLRIIRAKELAARTNHVVTCPKDSNWVKVRGEETKKSKEVSQSQRVAEKEEREELERVRRERAEKRMETLRMIGHLQPVDPRKTDVKEEGALGYEELSAQLKNYVEQRRKVRGRPQVRGSSTT